MCLALIIASLLFLQSYGRKNSVGNTEVLRRARILEETGNSRPHLPFGVTLIGPAWTDEFLWEIAAKYHAKTGLECGPTGHNVVVYRQR